MFAVVSGGGELGTSCVTADPHNLNAFLQALARMVVVAKHGVSALFEK